jgi:hypothetical protein
MDDGASYQINQPDGLLVGNLVDIVSVSHQGDWEKFMRLSICQVSTIEEQSLQAVDYTAGQVSATRE